MIQPQPQPNSKPSQPNYSEPVDLVVHLNIETPGDPFPPHVRERIKREVVDSYAVDRDLIAKVKQLAIHLGRQKADLICEGLALVLEKHRDQLDELLAARTSGEPPKPNDDLPPS